MITKKKFIEKIRADRYKVRNGRAVFGFHADRLYSMLLMVKKLRERYDLNIALANYELVIRYNDTGKVKMNLGILPECMVAEVLNILTN